MEVFASLGLLMSGCIDWKHCSLCGIGVEDQCDNLLGIVVASFTVKILIIDWLNYNDIPKSRTQNYNMEHLNKQIIELALKK